MQPEWWESGGAAARVAVLVPGPAGEALTAALAAARFMVVVRRSLAELPGCPLGVRPDLIVVHVAGFGRPEAWPQALRRTVGEKFSSPWSGVPLLVLDRPSEEWDMIGWASGGVDAYLRWPEAASLLPELLHRLLTEPPRGGVPSE